MFDKKTAKRLLRQLGRKFSRTTTVNIQFQLHTPQDYFNPAQDEVLMLDLLDKISQHAMGFHDVPGFQLQHLWIDGKIVLTQTRRANRLDSPPDLSEDKQ